MKYLSILNDDNSVLRNNVLLTFTLENFFQGIQEIE